MSTFKHLSHFCSKKSKVILSTYWKRNAVRMPTNFWLQCSWAKEFCYVTVCPRGPFSIFLHLTHWELQHRSVTTSHQEQHHAGDATIILLQSHKDFFQREMSLVDVSVRVSSDSDFLHWNRTARAVNCNPLNIARIFWNSTWLVMQGVNHITIVA